MPQLFRGSAPAQFLCSCLQFKDLHIADLPAPFFRGVVTSAPIAAGSKILEVPLSSCFSVNCVDSGIAAIIAALKAKSVPHSEDDVLALQLIKERFVLGEASAFAAHFATLPAGVDVPYFFSEEEMSAFRGTNAAKFAERLRAQIDRDFEAFSPVVAALAPRSGLPSSAFTPDNYKWAFSMVTSRCVSLRGVGKTMVPFFDMFNHSPVADVVHAYDPRSRSVQIVSRQGWDAGQQVFINYGGASSLRSLWLHGFVQPLPRFEAYEMELSVPRPPAAAGTAFDERVRLIERHGGMAGAPPPLALLAQIYKRAAAAVPPAAAAVAAEGGAGAAAPAAAASSAASDPDDLSALDMPEPPAAAAAATGAGAGADFDRWKAHVGSIGRTADGGLGVSAQLYAGVPHASLFRVMRIIHCPSAMLGALDGVLAESPDAGVDVEMEGDILKALGDSLVGVLKEIPALTEEEAGRRDALLALQKEGAVAMRALTARVQAELAAAGKPIKAPRSAEGVKGSAAADAKKALAGDDDDDGDDDGLFSALPGAGKKKAGAGAGAGKGGKAGGKKGGKSKAAAEAPAAGGAGASSPAAAPAELPALVAVAGMTPHEYRLAMGAYMRWVERDILTSQTTSMMEDMDALKAIAAQHNVANTQLRGGVPEALAADAPAAGGAGSA